MLIHGVLLLDVKVGVWCAVGATSGPTLFLGPKSTPLCKTFWSNCDKLSDYEEASAFLFQQDSVTSHNTITSVLCV